MTELLLTYIFYGMAILLGLIVLMVLRKKARAPSHETLRRQLAAFAKELDLLAPHPKSAEIGEMADGKYIDKYVRKYDFFQHLTKLTHRLSKLIYGSVLLEQKERDPDVAYLTQLLEGTLQDLNPYRFGKSAEETEGIESARQKVGEALLHLDRLLERNALLRKK